MTVTKHCNLAVSRDGRPLDLEPVVVHNVDGTAVQVLTELTMRV